MPLPEPLLKLWHLSPRAASRNLEITRVGKTVLAQFRNGSLVIDRKRILAMLSVAYGREIPAKIIDAFPRAEKHWKCGDKAMANISLALAGLRSLDLEIAHRLFACDWGLGRGMTIEQLYKIAGMLRKDDDDDDDDSDDDSDDSGDDSSSGGSNHYNPGEPRIPAGQPGGGEWTTAGNGATSDRGSISASDVRNNPTDSICYVFSEYPEPP